MICFLIIFSMMIFFEKSYTIPKVEISDLSLRDINSFTRVAGFVKYQNLRGDNLFVEFCSTQEFDDCIKLMLFKTNKELNKNQKYDIIGKLTYFNNHLEIIVRQVKIDI
ncbi:MAG: hypothetical protein HRU03_03840 [Nanoarchaeales archaeon]|nr:hypothetical protein [Nanoarchaeales archaeon]